MGAYFRVKVVAENLSGEQQDTLQGLIQSELQNVNSKMSTYLPSSELSRFNRLQETTPFPVSPEMLEVLLEAQRISAATGGAFDVTVGPLVNAWGFGPEHRGPVWPEQEEIDRLRSKVGWANIKIDEEASTIRKLDPAIYCDLSAIAKGYAVDRVSETLAAAGFVQHMVEVGGEIRTQGHNASGKPWRIAIERPVSGDRALQRVLPLADLAMATSGDYRNFFEHEGKRFSHTIDPRTGRPAEHSLASVSVVDGTCMQADGYATALMVLGEDEGYRLAVEQDLAALFLVRGDSETFQERPTPSFEKLFGAALGAQEEPAPLGEGRN